MVKLEVNKDIIKKFYDNRYQGIYMETHKGPESYRVKNVLSEIPDTVEAVLDYGCGQGGWIEILSNRFLNAKICGIDISDKAIELATKKFPQYNFFSFNGETAPFADNSFDLIFSYHVLEHVYDIQKTIFNISRLLKKSGYLCIIFPCGNKNSFEERITCLVRGGKEDSIDGRKRFFYEDSGHIRRMESREVIELFAQNNIRIYKEFYANQFWGAIEWMTKRGPVFINEFFNISRGINFLVKTKLFFLKVLFFIFSVPMKLYAVDLIPHIRFAKNMMKRIFLIMLMPLKILVIPTGKIMDLCSLLEWRFFKTRKSGSAQYLIFKK